MDTQVPCNNSEAAPETTSSSLEPTLIGVAWRDVFHLGAGVDAITGNTISVGALEPFRTIPGRSQVSTETIETILDFASMRKRLEIATKGDYNIGAVAIDESTRYLTEIRQSALEITYVVEYVVVDAAYDEAPETGYRLTEDAQRLMRDPARFRAAYGDYFVASRETGSSFRAVYALKARSEANLKQFESSAGVSAEGLFSKAGSTHFESEANALDIEVTSSVHMLGVSDIADQPVVSSPQDVPGALRWFKAHRASVPQLAKLVHYSALQPGYPRSVDIGPSVFVELRNLYSLLWDIRGLYGSLPKYYAEFYSDAFNEFDSSVVAKHAILPKDRQERAALRGQGDALFSQLMAVRSRQRFHGQVLQARNSEPGQGIKTEESRTDNHWAYGALASPDPDNIHVFSAANRYAEGEHVGWRAKTMEFAADPRFLVVGWQVQANWTDGSDGYWQQASTTNLLQHYAAVAVHSRYHRGLDWTVTFYYVDAEPYGHF
ncbi:hypothetical protein [Luteimonas suaedae]|uniref:hypothetical protein n=1 Tax=Luteimonas suaedae TaxID=2605430 RepID=UPI0011EDE4AB|nr:hypothetical protein [Luteimonas suaedae]